MKVSIIIPAYNHEKYINKTIQSVLNQTFEDFELIIINDGSSDQTENEILKFNDERIIYINQKNQGAHIAINKGIGLSKGEFISILNSDDLYKPQRIQKCLDFLKENTHYSVVISQLEGINRQGDTLEEIATPQISAWRDWYKDALFLYKENDFLLSCFAKNILITTSNFFMRKDVFESIGNFRKLRYTHDWDMLIRLATNNNVYLMKDNLLQYRIHEENTVHEDDSIQKVSFEVNWLIANGIRDLKNDINHSDLIGMIKNNHYIDFEVLSTMLICKSNPEQYLDFGNSLTTQMIECLRVNHK